jgi:8-oxo-dGTP pyrophosphatase MutT (NUDIX family)|tara:strand:+ start:3921 stop:4466 length:546 start_codon:yes stop_codon:yes gene_type:complete
MENIKKKRIYKNFFELNIKFDKKNESTEIKENYVFNGNSVSAICYNEKLKLFYFIKQFRPTYYFSKLSSSPLEIVAGGINKNETSREAIKREIQEELGVKPLVLKKLDTLIIAPDILEEMTDIYLAKVPEIKNFKISNPQEGEFIKIIPLKKNDIDKLLKSNKPQNIVTKYILFKIKELKI